MANIPREYTMKNRVSSEGIWRDYPEYSPGRDKAVFLVKLSDGSERCRVYDYPWGFINKFGEPHVCKFLLPTNQ